MSGLRFTLLGCGYSGGVPRADGEWGVCDPAEPRNRRSRCSLLVQRINPNGGEETTIIVDTSPDLRSQCLSAGVGRIDAALLTHEHADQTHGIDDLRAFFRRQGHRIPCWMDVTTTNDILQKFRYIFSSQAGYPAICHAMAVPPFGEAFTIDGPSGAIEINTFDQRHGAIPSVGYRIGDLAYSPDVGAIPEASFASLSGLKVWIVDALRWEDNPTHASVGKALSWIERVKPRHAVLTNMSLGLDYQKLRAQLPAGVEPGYDGLVIEL